MPTQEERLTALEFDLNHFKTETIKAYGEMAMELVMVKGLCEDAVKRLGSLRRSTEERFTQVRQDIAEVKEDMGEMRVDMAAMKQGMAEMQQNISGHTTHLERMETMLAQVLERLPEKS